MEKGTLTHRLYLSTIGADSRDLALQYGLGLELAMFCTAQNLDENLQAHMASAKSAMAGLDRFWFHAPFAELCPAAIDPRARALAADRYRQAIAVARDLGVHRLVVHGGYIPLVYFPEWFVAQSVAFWRAFLETAPEGISIALENVMEPGPEMLVEIVRQVDDPRLGLCLDVGHANTLVSRTAPLDWIGPMVPWLRHVHLHNNQGEMDLHSDLGTGTAPMEQILERLLTSCPDITFTLENQICRDSLNWLQRLGFLEGNERCT